MPPVIAALPLIAEIAGIGTGAVGIGEGIAAANSGGGGGVQPTTSAPPGGMNPQDMSSLVESIRKQFPDFQANTGGAVGAGAIADTASAGAGHPGDMNAAMQAVNQWLGQGLTGNAQAPVGGGSPPPPGSGGGGGSAPGFDIQQFIKGLNKTRPGMTYQNPF